MPYSTLIWRFEIKITNIKTTIINDGQFSVCTCTQQLCKNKYRKSGKFQLENKLDN